MIYAISPVHQLRHERGIHDTVDRIFKMRVGLDMLNIPDGPGRKIIDNGNMPTFIQQRFNKIGTDKTRSSSD
jgi:hypothetical protein